MGLRLSLTNRHEGLQCMLGEPTVQYLWYQILRYHSEQDGTMLLTNHLPEIIFRPYTECREPELPTRRFGF